MWPTFKRVEVLNLNLRVNCRISSERGGERERKKEYRGKGIAVELAEEVGNSAMFAHN